jgi:hypothetical protein
MSIDSDSAGWRWVALYPTAKRVAAQTISVGEAAGGPLSPGSIVTEICAAGLAGTQARWANVGASEFLASLPRGSGFSARTPRFRVPVTRRSHDNPERRQ